MRDNPPLIYQQSKSSIPNELNSDPVIEKLKSEWQSIEATEQERNIVKIKKEIDHEKQVNQILDEPAAKKSRKQSEF